MVISYISVQKKERKCLSINASLYHQQEPFIPLSFITLKSQSFPSSGSITSAVWIYHLAPEEEQTPAPSLSPWDIYYDNIFVV